MNDIDQATALRDAYRRLAALGTRADQLLARTAERARFDGLLVTQERAGEFSLDEEGAAAERALAAYVEQPTAPEEDELLRYHQDRADVLRELVHEHGETHLAEDLAEAKALASAVMRRQVRVLSFGFGHHGNHLPEDLVPDVLLDLRRHFRDPHVRTDLRGLTGHDEKVRRHVMDTPGIRALLDATAAAVGAFASGPTAAPVTVAVGCAGGRHRSVAVAAALGTWLGGEFSVCVEHLDVHRPVIEAVRTKAVPTV
ncbi:RapZ C-terminal domain-containing protein [Streptomyces violascens]|uniref:RapZ C-terminal domain-containing protein n=1 Tax=Streptomyces violascens TaxID=67381 RepID=UPI003674F3C0